MSSRTLSARERLLEAAADLLVRDGDFSTRAVCDAAGVGAPTLYHHFGGKDGLVEAAIAHASESRIERKRALDRSGEPLDDLRRGWDDHVAFAVEHPALYRLFYARVDEAKELPPAAREAREILLGELEAIARAGQLRAEPELAADVVHAAAHGVGSLLASRPGFPWHEQLSAFLREAVIAAITGDGGAAPDGHPARGGDAARHALALSSLLADRPAGLSPAESGLLQEWLARLATPETQETSR
jgi:AcrR family transcriptional regulator